MTDDFDMNTPTIDLMKNKLETYASKWKMFKPAEGMYLVGDDVHLPNTEVLLMGQLTDGLQACAFNRVSAPSERDYHDPWYPPEGLWITGAAQRLFDAWIDAELNEEEEDVIDLEDIKEKTLSQVRASGAMFTNHDGKEIAAPIIWCINEPNTSTDTIISVDVRRTT